MIKERSLKTLPLDGGTLPFHFVNTVYAWKGENLHEYLNSYEDVLEWCNKVKSLPTHLLTGLREYASKHPKKKLEALEYIKHARRILYQFFSGVAATGIETSILNQYNTLLNQALAHFEWKPQKKELHFTLKENATDLLQPLWMVLKASHQLLLETNDERIKECSRCGWIFLDETKNNNRRWCNPSTCGSVEKMHRYYQKVKKNKVS
jgi:predicted RNA-binding Zn ribbon-like protein